MNCPYKKNSKNILPGDTFFSILGKYHNGNNFIEEAVNNGAIKIIVEKTNRINDKIKSFLELHSEVTICYVNNILKEFASQLKNFYEINVNDFVFIGVTGTKGKTTTSVAIFNFLQKLGHSAAIMCSALKKINSNEISKLSICNNILTTGMADDIYNFLYQAKIQKVKYIILEVAAQAFSQNRIYGILFDIFVYTNFCPEHGEFYITQDDYYNAKLMLYNYMKQTATIILNKDDEKVLLSKKEVKNNSEIKFFGSKSTLLDIKFSVHEESIKETKAIITYKDEQFYFTSRWCGLYNIANITAAILAIDLLCNLTNDEIINLLNETLVFSDIPGRNERYYISNNRVVCIEKACTPNSIEPVLVRLGNLTNNLIVIFGCGGNKDLQKRPIIANLIEKFADTIYVTMDNPRTEPIEKIFSDISAGFSFTKDTFFIKDRKQAIELAIQKSQANSVIVLFGKGDEDYQEINNVKYPFLEKNIIQEFLESKDI